MKNYGILIEVALVALSMISSFGADSTSPQLRQQAQQCRDLLKSSLVDFYLPNCLDWTNGGYMENLDRDGHFTLTGEKFLTLQARQVWFFSTLAREGIEKEKSLEAAKLGFKFIHGKMRDPKFGGYYSKVTDDGNPKDARKHAYLNSFALYSFAAYFQASKDSAALKAAKELFDVLEKHSHDELHGGYIEFFTRDWHEVTNNTGGGYVGAVGHKTYNTHLHLMEAMAELYRVWPDPRVLKRLNELIVINTSTVMHPTVNNNIDAYLRDWKLVNTSANLRASFGHDLECIWLVADAAKTAGESPKLYRNWAEKLAANCMSFGYDKDHGGFYESGPLSAPANNRRKTWWVQNEAMVGLLELYEQTGKREYYDAFSKTLDFCAKYQVAREGGWWATRNPDGSPAPDKTRTSMWQGAYHAGRSLLESSHRLERLAAGK
jgi:cellobiose epimerase